MAGYHPPRLVGIAAMAVVCHLCAFASIFDIYFRSPIVNGLEPVPAPSGSGAKRVVVIVGDGCRSDMFYDEETWKATGKRRAGGYLRSKILDGQTSWGVSHTRVPTESRPCHASLLGGIYEDPSAITKGWQDNPVEFDTVINATSAAFAFGSPDVIPLFARGISHVTADSYPADWEDFGAGCYDQEMGCKRLDQWVVTRLRKLFGEDARGDAMLRRRLNGDNVIIFLHLLGLDMNGHAYRPNSHQYKDNIRYVDDLVKTVEESVSKYFRDSKTAYVFTADHGMSNKGSHGDGEPECTQTPLVVWGAGVSKSHAMGGGQVAPGHREDGIIPQTPESWGALSSVPRKDVEQAQIAPLVSVLLGTHIPVNNVGIIPLSYVHSPQYSSRPLRLLLQNAMQLLRILDRKEALKFPPSRGDALRKSYSDIQEMVERGGKAEEAEARCRELIATLLQGNEYYNTYDRLFLQCIILSAYLGGMLCMLLHVDSTYSGKDSGVVNYVPSEECIYGSFVCFILLWLQGSPWQYSLYVALSAYLWDQALSGGGGLKGLKHGIVLFVNKDYGLWGLAGGFVVLELMIRGFADRAYYTPCHIIIGVTGLCGVWVRDMRWRWAWAAACCGASLFTLLSVEYGDEMLMAYGGGLMLMGASLFAAWDAKTAGDEEVFQILSCQGAAAAVAIACLSLSVRLLEAGSGLPLVLWALNWIILAASLAAPSFVMQRTTYWAHRLVSLYVGWGVPYMMLSVNYETLFYCCLCAQLGLWVILEKTVRGDHTGGVRVKTRASPKSHVGLKPNVPIRDLATGLAVLFFVDASFFGTGNISSVSSFELKSVYRFMAVFNPFLMGGMLLFKIALPFVLVAATFRTITTLEHINKTAVLCLLLILADIKSMHFFFGIRTEGSWKDIGQSISIFGIANFIIVMILLLFMSTARIANGVAYRTRVIQSSK